MLQIQTKILLGALGLVTLIGAGSADARRRIVGAEQSEETKEKVAPKLTPEEVAKQKEAAKAKAKAAKMKAREERRKKDEAAEKKREAEEAAEEAAEKAKEEAEKKASAAKVAKEEARLAGNKKQRLAGAEAKRRLWRNDGEVELTFSVMPGKVSSKKMVDMRIDIARRLEVANARSGDLTPETRARVVVTVTPEGAKEGVSYRLHPLGTPGAYGMHFTPEAAGPHTVTFEGKTAAGKSVSGNFRVFADEWPPPDYDEEEKVLHEALKKGAARTGRTLVK